MESISKNSKESKVCYEHLEEWVRMKVQEFIQEILEEEVTAFLGRERYERKEGVDRRKGYRNGYGKRRKLCLKTGTIEIRRPRLRNLEERFESRIIPLFKRRSEEVGEALLELYLHGLSKGDFELALRGILGESAPLSPASLQRLKAKWQKEYERWREEDLSGLEPVYLWADGLYVKAGLGKEKAALLIVIVALKDGRKKVVAVEAGYRESVSCWADVLRSVRERGLKAPCLVIADGNLGIWGAVREVWPEAKEQRCWNHKILNVLEKLPKRVQSEAKEYLLEMPYAKSKEECERLKAQFEKRFKEYPSACEALRRDWERMVTFYEFPKEHWRHIRTTNVIESPFFSVRLRTNVARRMKNIGNAVALIWKVLMVAEKRFRRISAPHLLAEVYEGAIFVNGERMVMLEKERRATA